MNATKQNEAKPATFTAARWEITRKFRSAIIIMAGKTSIANVNTYSCEMVDGKCVEIPNEGCEANARLIASSPRMAALIRKIYDAPGALESLSPEICREMTDLLTEVGLIK